MTSKCQILQQDYQNLKVFLFAKGGSLAKISEFTFFVILVYISPSKYNKNDFLKISPFQNVHFGDYTYNYRMFMGLTDGWLENFSSLWKPVLVFVSVTGHLLSATNKMFV